MSTGLEAGEDGVWYAHQASAVAYPAEGHARLAELEDDSFWFAHRNRCIEALIKAYPPEAGNVLFDIGGGNGYVAGYLQEAGMDVVLVEPGHTGISTAKSRGLKHLVCATLEHAEFHEGSLPAVGMFDVIEHIEDDAGTLARVHSQLAPGGMLYLTVPAYSLLWSLEDIEAGHFRRYDRGSISDVLAETGFRVEFATYFFRALVVPIYFFRSLPFKLGINRGEKRKRVAKDHKSQQSLAGKLLDASLSGEVERIRKGRAMGFGSSCLVAARRA
jgi:SAM-dependent methyltransferase